MPVHVLKELVPGDHARRFSATSTGKRLLRREAGKSVLYLGMMELEATAGAVVGRRYYQAADGITLAMRQGGQAEPTWLLAGLSGSIELSLGATGTVERQKYLPFGERRGSRDDIPGTTRGFLGQQEDPVSSLVYMNARFYAPGQARFISPDPILDIDKPGLGNSYSYAAGDPLGKTDPSGLLPVEIYADRCDEEENDPGCPRRQPLPDLAEEEAEGESSILSELGENLGMRMAESSARLKKVPLPPECRGISAGECLIVMEWGRYAQKLSGKGHSEKDGCSRNKPCKVNAIRHCIWQMALTDTCGEEVAQKVAENHEKGNSKNDPDTKADRWNNNVAQGLAYIYADRIEKIRTGPGTREARIKKYFKEIKAICEQAWADGALKSPSDYRK
ncbi:RHS repeat domain-containing protein [Herbidospora mongoliensis]|uniref:RHS repeat domain-containing protein n=1 Tax=Herbidospora mongoliensis TaxID=688067 RepID=UPI00082BBE70|nr:RHS repeat-associated core domain-containing protein [Herbidospora mongoliensis]